MRATKLFGLIFLAILVVSASITSLYHLSLNGNAKEKFFFGVSYGQNTVDRAKILIDKVKNYTNLFVINSYPITTNYTSPEILNEICDYAAKSDLYFIVYFFSLHADVGDWQQEWIDFAKQTWGDRFLGIHLRDEPGGRQIEAKDPVDNASDYKEAAESYVSTISSYFSNQFLNRKGVPIFVSDFVLYYYDFLAGYDTVFAEFGWNNSRVRETGLCRGAANMMNKDWGVTITWTYNQPPYIGSVKEIYQDMITAYDGGAKYVILFNYPQYPEDNQYGILTDEHFLAMEQFWEYVSSHPQEPEKIEDRVAYVLPNYYGWGMRRPDDNIWGIWDADEKSPTIWENLIKLENKYGLKLDIIYDNPQYDIQGKYSQTYAWNSSIN
jgi:hypothetical protein